MKTKLKVISFLLSLSFIIAAVCISFAAPSGGSDNYLIAVPKINGTAISIKTLEDVNENKTMLTYENIYDKTVRALQSNHSVILKGTNYTYPYVMNYSITSGGFFSKKASENKNKVAVINEKAAFDIFGTLNAVGNELQIDMLPYAVVGVINDNDTDNPNIFIPASCLAESAGSILVNLSNDSELTEEYAKNELKYIGIDELKHDFINLGIIIKAIKDKAIVSAEFVLLGILLIVLKKFIGLLIEKSKEIKRRQQQFYFKEMLKDKAKPVQKLILLSTATVGMIISGFLLILNMFEVFLNWNTLRGVFNDINYTSFALNIARIERWYLFSNVLFIGFVIVFVMFMVTIWD